MASNCGRMLRASNFAVVALIVTPARRWRRA
jgi:hypothetical protein